MALWTIAKITVPRVAPEDETGEVVCVMLDKTTGLIHSRTEDVAFTAGAMDVSELLNLLDANFAPNDFGLE